MAGETSGLRLTVLALVVLGLFAALFSRLWFLEVAAPPDLITQVQERRIKTVQLPAMRGRVVDRDGRILADNRRVLNIVVDRKSTQRKADRTALFQRLAGVLQVSVEDMEDRVTGKETSALYEPVLPLPLAEDVTEEQAAYLRERAEDFGGVDVQETWQRVYRYAPLASNIVGYLGRVSKEEWPTLQVKGYQYADTLGKAGIEREYEAQLRGKPGFAKFEIDAAGRPVRSLEGADNRQEPVAGQDVQLTVDLRVQQYAEQILDAELRKRRLERPPRPLIPGTNQPDTSQPLKPLFPAGAGSLVVEDPQTGEVLAMASNPPYDNRWFTAPLTKAKFTQLFGSGNNQNTPLINRPISGQYQIGSTMKLFTAIAGLRYGTLDPYDQPEVENGKGLFEIPGCQTGEPSGCFKRNSGGFKYGRPVLWEALAVSSDTYFYNQGAKLFERGKELGADVLQNELRSFGFGGATGIDLPDENTGYVPDAALKKKFADRGVISKREGAGYYIGDNINLAVGQGLLSVTPLQLANAYATFGNGGTLREPRIAYGLRAPGGATLLGQPNVLDVISSPAAQVLGPVLRDQPVIELSDSVRAPIMQGLKGVSQDWNVCSLDAPCPRPGTAFDTFRNFNWEEFPFYGKTGTAQDVTQQDEKDDSLFTAFGGPAGAEPQFQVTAVLENSGFGSSAAALTVRCMFTKLRDRSTFADVKPSDPLVRTQARAAVLPRLSDDDQVCLHVVDDQIYDAAYGTKSGSKVD